MCMAGTHLYSNSADVHSTERRRRQEDLQQFSFDDGLVNEENVHLIWLQSRHLVEVKRTKKVNTCIVFTFIDSIHGKVTDKRTHGRYFNCTLRSRLTKIVVFDTDNPMT